VIQMIGCHYTGSSLLQLINVWAPITTSWCVPILCVCKYVQWCMDFS